MVKYSFHNEVYNVLTQFVAAFDDCFIYRYTKEGVQEEKIKVRYIFGPKQRVIYDIVNPAKNITLPAIAIEQTGISRDSTRIQHKDQNMYRSHNNKTNVSKIPTPIPVSIDLTVSIITGFKEDMDQIANNILSWCNPYLIISWKVPDEFGLDYSDELRSEVKWSGSINYESPTNIEKQEKYRIVGNTNFTIKSWIFPPAEQNVAPIYVVNSKFNAVGTDDNINIYNYENLSETDYPVDNVLISAYPEITNMYFNGIPIYDDLDMASTQDNNFLLYGKRYSYNNSWYLSGDFTSSLLLEEIETAKFPIISAYRIPDEMIRTIGDNVASFTLSSGYVSNGVFSIVTSNSAGWINSDYSVAIS